MLLLPHTIDRVITESDVHCRTLPNAGSGAGHGKGTGVEAGPIEGYRRRSDHRGDFNWAQGWDISGHMGR